jgi:hypothetical protein
MSPETLIEIGVNAPRLLLLGSIGDACGNRRDAAAANCLARRARPT